MFIGDPERDLNGDELKGIGLVWENVKEQLQLIVSMCAGENYICIHYFKRFFTEAVLINRIKLNEHQDQCKLNLLTSFRSETPVPCFTLCITHNKQFGSQQAPNS